MRPIIDDELWEAIAPLLPPEKPKPKGGRPRIPDRAVLTGILFILRSGIPFEMLPREMGCGSGMTCWRRLEEWQASGVWKRLHQVFLEKLGRAGEIDWSRASVDSATVAAKKGATKQDLIQPTKANLARNIIFLSIATAFRSVWC